VLDVAVGVVAGFVGGVGGVAEVVGKTARRQAWGSAEGFAVVMFFCSCLYDAAARGWPPPKDVRLNAAGVVAVSVIAVDGAAACERNLLSVHRWIARRRDLRCHLFERPERSGAMVGLPAILSPPSPPSIAS
jgi:hypothetical protein